MQSASTTIFDENNKALITLFRKHDGDFDHHAKELVKFLSEFTIVPLWQVRLPVKSAQGMGDLAAQLVKQFKVGIGADLSVSQHVAQQFHYEITYVPAPAWGGNARVALAGRNIYAGATKVFRLYSDDPAPVILRRVQFVYDKRDGEQAKWRTVDVTAEDTMYIEGLQDGQFKRFLKSKILGGKILPA